MKGFRYTLLLCGILLWCCSTTSAVAQTLSTCVGGCIETDATCPSGCGDASTSVYTCASSGNLSEHDPSCGAGTYDLGLAGRAEWLALQVRKTAVLIDDQGLGLAVAVNKHGHRGRSFCRHRRRRDGIQMNVVFSELGVERQGVCGGRHRILFLCVDTLPARLKFKSWVSYDCRQPGDYRLKLTHYLVSFLLT
jgi:hypothetical protein